MSTTDRLLDESTATLVSPDDHLHAKNLLNMPSKASTGVSSGTVSTEEPSTPETPAAELTAPVSIKCGWPNAAEGVEGQPPVPEVKTLATEGPEGQPPWGSKGLTAALQKPQAAPADANSGWPHLDKEQPKTKDANSGWPHFDKEQPETKDASSGWPHLDKEQPETKDANSGWPHFDKEQPKTKDADSKWPGDSNNPDDPKHQTGHGTHSSGSDAASRDASGTLTVQCGWPNGTTKPQPTVPGRNDPGSFGPRGQPPWGTQKVATASPEGQPPWGISNLAAANASQPNEGPEGQPPWGSKGLAIAHPDKPTDA
ncbi:hypothetical protein LEL_08850 [Akanthomyces lecanii RCEF 1005]|uniref:Uncharacterized protein n=1 Tax=Akanthomyces lecanii RCEF 1005 TaxID=1081108 RepID=A0A168DVN9_CORDF|nr:hypothetical protein LEL_08850 [Akanthomyces lecanii RCEF 1005]